MLDSGRKKDAIIAHELEQEKKTIAKMIRIYCRANHRDSAAGGARKGDLCPECEEMLAYALLRIEKCPFKEGKDFCSNCKVHCYEPAMREKIRVVMRYSGPRMIYHDPPMAIRHIISVMRSRKDRGTTA